MNERIRELALQAMTATTNKFSADREWSADEWRDFYDSKFAELIVRECAKALDDKLANPNGASVAYCDGSDLLEHFGVEE